MTFSMASIDSPLGKTGALAKLRALQFRLSRRALFSWIRPTVLGCDAEQLGIDADDLVCYIMPYQSTADLMVVDHATEAQQLPQPTDPMGDFEARSFFFLGHPEGLIGRKTLRGQSDRMLRILEHQRQNPATTKRQIKIVPVSLFWGHQPDREKSIFKLLLSENWTVTSGFRKMLSALVHRQHIFVQFSPAIDLGELIANEVDPEKQTRKLHRILRTHFTHQKQAIIGPDLSHRRTLISVILEGTEVKQAITDEVTRRGVPQHKIEKEAFRYANEIASDQSYRVIRFFHVLLTWLWNNLYDGIDVSRVEIAKTLARTHEVIYTPCHRSHIDYLLLSYVLYHNGLTPPHIAAGKNLNLPIAGPLLRRAGAFFMRRSFRDDRLYSAVFDEYLHQMFTRGYSIEYFIEGGRSRTGRTLMPRTGMLSMTLSSFQRDAAKPIAFLPVYFGYERLMEAPTYMDELAGKSKKEESVLDLFSIFRSFAKPFGRVAVNFGEPLILNEFLDETWPDWQASKDSEKFSASCTTLAQQLAHRINGAAAVTPTNLLATALLATPRQTITEERLISQVTLLQRLANANPPSPHITVTDKDPKDAIQHAAAVAQIERIETPFGAIYQADQTAAILLTYYQNNTIHVFALASLLARMIRFNKLTQTKQLISNCEVLQPYLEAEMMLSWEDLAGTIAKTLTLLSALGVVVQDGDVIKIPSPTSDQYANLTDLAEIIEPTLERFYIVTALLKHNSAESAEHLEEDASGIAQQLSTIYGLSAPEFFDKKLFTRFVTTLRQERCLNEQVGITSEPKFERLSYIIQAYLDSDVSFNVLQAIPDAPQERRTHIHQTD
ncbi:MAG: glycerol-3-phosphate O-acyltransferase [Sulfitobacter sp.]|jgi:glycerol-3-phosphate O-acyltransferase